MSFVNKTLHFGHITESPKRSFMLCYQFIPHDGYFMVKG